MLAIGFHALSSHWFRAPFQLFILVFGLAFAVALWVGVQLINAQARQSYSQAEEAMSRGQILRVVPQNGDFSWQDFAKVRRAGFLVSPFYESQISMGTFRGIDPFTAPFALQVPEAFEQDGRTAFLSNPPAVFASLQSYEQTQAFWRAEGFEPKISQTLGNGLFVADIAAVQIYLGSVQITGFVLPMANDAADLETRLKQHLPDLRIVRPASNVDLAELTASFHMNLTAFGALAFLVGIFIVQATVSLSFYQRAQTLNTLKVMGFSSRALAGLMVLEVLLLAFFSASIGLLLGHVLATALLPSVSATLGALYGARVSSTLTALPAVQIIGAFAIALLGALAASGFYLMKLIQPKRLVAASKSADLSLFILGAVLLSLAFCMIVLADGLLAGFGALALLLLGAACAMPKIVSFLLCFGKHPHASVQVYWQWFFAELRSSIPHLRLPLMALMLAVAANIGVSTMVGSFRTTFIGWLDQRLFADLYVTAQSEEQAALVLSELRDQGVSPLPIQSAKDQLGQTPAEIYGIANDPLYASHWPMVAADTQVWERLAKGEGILINEQLSHRRDLQIGDLVELRTERFEILGIYSDYGNPQTQGIVAEALFQRLYPDLRPRGFAISTQTPAIMRQQIEALGVPASGIIEQGRIKALSREIFEQTFVVTDALNILTLGVAAFALWASLTSQSSARLPQLAPLRAMGVPRAHILRLEVLRLLALVSCAAFYAVPVGLALAWILLAIVNVEAFGWRLPMSVQLFDVARVLFFALLAGLFALLPTWRLLAKKSDAEAMKRVGFG